MLIRQLRQNAELSQEQLAQETGLSLRTIQRVEAGHRVSYASLRALAATFETNVDSLEQELYAMKNMNNEFIEKPLWVRLLLSLPSIGKLDLSGLKRHELSLVAYSVFAYIASFLVPRIETEYWGITTVDLLYFSAFTSLLLAYVTAITPRLRDKFGPST
ncbi:helix-turn-helix domain-containing protein [Aliikangiella sp. IMCC44653]